MTTNSIPRYQADQIKSQLESSRLFILEGPAKNDKLNLVLNIISEISSDHHLLLAADIKEAQRNEGTWKKWTKSHWDKPYLILHRAELIKDLDGFIEHALSAENSPTIICICDYKPAINEMLAEALSQNGSYVEIYPLSFYEIAQHHGLGTIEQQLEERLIHGAYPNIMAAEENAQEKLNHIIDDMLGRSLSSTDRVNKKDNLKKVLQVFAFEMGNMISFNEVATRTDLDNETVERYVRLFEKAFIVKVVPCFYGGNKYEMKKGASVFFVDNGIRNALINNFNPMDWRQDATQLWRNWLFIEKFKWNNLLQRKSELYTWRTHTTQRIDFMEVFEGNMKGFQTS